MGTIALSASTFLRAAVFGMLIREDWPLLCGPRRRTQGIVVDRFRRTIDRNDHVAPKVRFFADGGRQFEITDTYGQSTKKPPVGAALEVIYPITNPGKARVRHPGHRLVISTFVIATLAILILHVLGLLRSFAH